MGRKAFAEFLGTFWLVFGGCGTAVLAGHQVGWVGVSIAFGLTVLSMAYAIGHISGCHLNPAVTTGLVVGGREKPATLPIYWVAQVLGAIAAAYVLRAIALGGTMGAEALRVGGFAANGYGEHSPEHYDLSAAFLSETILTFFFLLVILGTTDGRAPKGFAGLAIGLALTLIHLIGIPITNLSVNPARSTGPALVVGEWALSQLWLFWVAPLVGAAAAGGVYRVLGAQDEEKPAAAAAPAPSA
jgi:aquaporin Z